MVVERRYQGRRCVCLFFKMRKRVTTMFEYLLASRSLSTQASNHQPWRENTKSRHFDLVFLFKNFKALSTGARLFPAVHFYNLRTVKMIPHVMTLLLKHFSEYDFFSCLIDHQQIVMLLDLNCFRYRK